MPNAVNEKLVHEQCCHVPARLPWAEHPVHERTGVLRAIRHEHLAPPIVSTVVAVSFRGLATPS